MKIQKILLIATLLASPVHAADGLEEEAAPIAEGDASDEAQSKTEAAPDDSEIESPQGDDEVEPEANVEVESETQAPDDDSDSTSTVEAPRRSAVITTPVAVSTDDVGQEKTKTVLRNMSPGEERRYVAGVLTLTGAGTLALTSGAMAALSFNYAGKMRDLQDSAIQCPGSAECIELDVAANSRANTARLSLGLGIAAAATATVGTILLVSVPNKHIQMRVGASSVHLTGSF